MNESLTLAELHRWEDNGATWRALEVDDDFAVVELCACTGEAMERARGRDPELIAHIRARLAERPPGSGSAGPSSR